MVAETFTLDTHQAETLERLKAEWCASGETCYACEHQVVNKSHHYDCPVRKFYRIMRTDKV